ncbi:MAG: aspartate/glutamate racemase family protein [bacterium]|nr:aspartate/glutamate racemase family protein [bacterium]
MPNTLALLHTAPLLINTFNDLGKEFAPDIPLQHIVDDSLLQQARDAGGITPELNRRVCDMVLHAVDSGANLVLCTCSSIGPSAEVARQLTSRPVLRIDQPMAEEAVRTGNRIVVAATLSSTLVPTRDIVLAAAQNAGREVQVVELLCKSAWAELEKGNPEGYHKKIAEDLQESARDADVIVLAQASMAHAAGLCPDLGIPVLTSPRSGLQAALEAYRSTPTLP